MRTLIVLALLLAPAARAEIRSAEDCAAAVAADPAAAREDAALWQRLGGGVPARLCEAEALSALGAHATAARLLTGLADNRNRAIDARLRAETFADAAQEWLAAGRPDLARAALAQADRLTPADPGRLILRARAEAAESDWPTAQATLEAAVAAAPDDALAHALLAAALRNQGDATAALTQAERARDLDPWLPEAIFEAAAALAETGAPDRAAPLWLDLIRRDPDSPLATLARRNLQRLN
jgi:tetratricopeptide (TPR) repeat protein